MADDGADAGVDEGGVGAVAGLDVVEGTLVVALVQGTLGGMMFWWLDLPAPLMWGAIMAVLAVL